MQKSKRSAWGGTVLRVTVSAVLLFFVFRKFQWAQLGAEFRAASPAWLLGAWLLFGAAVAFSGVRWWLILRGQGVRVSLRNLLAIVWISQFFNIFLLGSTGGDLIRVLYIIREAPHAKARAGVSILLDRVFGMVILAAVAMCAAGLEWPLFSARAELHSLFWALALILAASLAGCAFLLWFPFARVCLRWPALARHATAAQELQDALRAFARSPLLVGAVLPISIVVHICNFAGGYCVARAIGLGLALMSVGVIFALVFFIVAIPVSIAGHGLRESAFVLMFSMFGIGSTPAVAVSLLYAGLATSWGILGGIVYWVYKSQGSLPLQAPEKA